MASIAGPLQRDAEAPLSEQLADRIEGLIREHTLEPGGRVPSVRQAKRQFGVSTGTVLDAYHRLENRGLVEARPRSGYFVRPDPGGILGEPRVSAPDPVVRTVEQPLALRMLAAASEAETVSLGSAVPDASFLPISTLNRCLTRALRDEPLRGHGYALPAGDPELRRQIVRRMFDAGTHVDPEQVLVTNGTNEALHLALRAVTRPGDVVAVEAPTYYGLLDALRSASLRILPIATSPRDGLSLEALASALHTGQVRACALVTNYSNPLGASMTDPKKRALLALLEEHDVPLIEDDIYGELSFDDHRPSAVKAFDERGSVIYCSSFSKTVTPGWRIGWCVAGRWHSRVEQLKYELNYCTAWAPQRALASYLSSGSFPRHLRRLRHTYREQVARTTAEVARHFPEGTCAARPRGGQVLWVEMPGEVDSLVLYEAARAEGISIAPGVLFGVGDDAFRHCIRLNCGVPWTPRVEHAIARVGALAHTQLG